MEMTGGEQAAPAPALAAAAQPKKFACMSCRTRKLRCDSERPKCGNCAKNRLGTCEYIEPSRRRVTKRRNLGALEARLSKRLSRTKQHELIKTVSLEGKLSQLSEDSNGDDYEVLNQTPRVGVENFQTNREMPSPHATETVQGSSNSNASSSTYGTLSFTDPSPLGTDEILLDVKAMRELNEVYFEKVHPTVPVLHKQRFIQACNSKDLNSLPSLSLRYAVWMIASSMSDKYRHLESDLYVRSRKLAHADEMAESGPAPVHLDEMRYWIIIVEFEMRNMLWTRVWTSLGRAIRLGQFLGLDALDDPSEPPQSPCLKDWTEIESGRRLFWYAFCMDRYSAVITGRPLTIQEDDIMTNLPAEEISFRMSIPQMTETLARVRSLETKFAISPYASYTIPAALFGDLARHMRKKDSRQDQSDVINGAFWKRHWDLDAKITRLQIVLPSAMRSGPEYTEGNVLGVTLMLYALAIGLYKAAALKAVKFGLEKSISEQCAARCQNASHEIVKNMKAAGFASINSWPTFTNVCMFMCIDSLIEGINEPFIEHQCRRGLEVLLTILRSVRQIDCFLKSLIAVVQKGLNRPIIGWDTHWSRVGDKINNDVSPVNNLVLVPADAPSSTPNIFDHRSSALSHVFGPTRERSERIIELRPEELPIPDVSLPQYNLNVNAFDSTETLFGNTSSAMDFDFALAVQQMQDFQPDDPLS